MDILSLPKILGVALKIYSNVKEATEAGSDNGKKISPAEWSSILSEAFVDLAEVLTVIFGGRLDQAAANMFDRKRKS